MIFGILHSNCLNCLLSFSRLTAREITYNNFEILVVVFMPNTTTNHAIIYKNHELEREPAAK